MMNNLIESAKILAN